MHRPAPTETRVLVATAGFSVLVMPLLYLTIKRASTATLKAVLPWLSTGVSVTGFIAVALAYYGALTGNKSLRFVVAFMILLLLSFASDWIKRKLEFVDPPSLKAMGTARLLRIPGHTYIESENPSAAAGWYFERLGLRRLAATKNSDPNTIRLKFSYGGTEEVRLAPRDPLSLRGAVILYCRRLKRARELLRDRGIDVGPIQGDRQGTSYFEFCDPEGNVIEVSEEPAGALGGEIL